MVESMIERVAKTICAADNDGSSWPDSPHGDPIWEDHRGMYLRIARSVLEAMREPTDAMVDAGAGADHTLEAIEDCPEYPESCANIYRAMIDAAFNEQVSD